METTRPETPQSVKTLFQEFLFPCSPKKTPAIGHGNSWEYNNKQKKPIIRSIEAALCGIDCGQAKTVIIDCDTYKRIFQESEPAKAFFNECKKKCQFYYQTPSGGWHFYFRMPFGITIPSSAPYPGVEIKAKGGYCCVYAHPAELAGYDDWNSFYNDLPVFDFKQWGTEQHGRREFGPGKNHKAIPQRAGRAGAKQSAEQAAQDIYELFKKNAGRANFDWKKHLTDYLQNYEKNFFLKTPPPQDTKKPENKNQPIFFYLDKVKTRPITYLDDCKMFLKGYLTTLAGAKGSLKSRGVLSYLLKQKKKVGYFSDNENTQGTIKRIAEATGYGQNLVWFDFSRTNEKEFWEQIANGIQQTGIDVMLEDPPFESVDFSNIVGIRKVLGKRAQMSDLLNCGWVVTRNFSKNESRQLENRVGGFAHWVTMPRACIMTHKAEKNTAVFKETQNSAGITKDGLLHLALLQSWVVNEGPLPEKSIKMQMEKGEDGPIMTFSQINRVASPQLWGKSPSTQEKETTETLINLSLALLKTQSMSSGDFKRLVCNTYKISLSGAKRIVRLLKDQKYITGGGSGPSSDEFSITDTGRSFLDQ